MAFEKSHFGKSVTARKKSSPVFCVGWRAFVHWPARLAAVHGSVPLTDLNGGALPNDLADGQQIEIISWRPRSREGVLYQISRLSDGSEWWIAPQYLRRQCQPEGADTAGDALSVAQR